MCAYLQADSEFVSVAGRKDIKDEIHVMASALYKEMEMLETQLNRSKIAAHDALKSREDADSLRAVLDRKVFNNTCFVCSSVMFCRGIIFTLF